MEPVISKLSQHCPRLKVVTITALLGFLTNCGIAEKPDPAASTVPFAAPETIAARENYVATFGVLVARTERGTTQRYVTASLKPMVGRWDHYTSAGQGSAYPFEVTVRPSNRNNWTVTQITASDLSRVARIDNGVASESEAMAFALRVARATFCKGGIVTENRSAGRVFRDPADISAIVGASAAAQGQRDTIPNSVKGEALPSIERVERNGWLIRLRCSLWRAP